MNRIGILTFHRSTNNGALIQCYSLACRLQTDFPESSVEVIDYSMPRVNKHIYAESISEYLSECNLRERIVRLKTLLKDPYKIKRQKEKNDVFRLAVRNLPLSSEYIYENSTERLFQYLESKYDQVVVGSDAVWNYTLRGFPNPYFLNERLNVKKYAYAASCYGMNYELIPDAEKEQIGRTLNSYLFIGVRDEESCKFAKSVGCNLPIYHTCDPTVFLDTDSLPVNKDVLMDKLRSNGYDEKKQSIGVMGSNKICKMVKRLFGKQYQIVSLFNYCQDADVNLYSISPFEWAYVFRLFRITFTTYFHGTLLSLRNGVPVICIELSNEYSKVHMSKVEDFLIRLNLQKYYFRTDCSGKDDLEIKSAAVDAIYHLTKSNILSSMEREERFYELFKKELMNTK